MALPESAVLTVSGLPRALGRIADVLMPPTCACCKVPVVSPGYCSDCWEQLAEISGAQCGSCGIPLPLGQQADVQCLECMRAAPAWDRAMAAYLYAGAARETLLAFKNGREELAPVMAQAMARAGRPLLLPGALLVPVPLHRWRLWTRGYNQSALLARGVALHSGLQLELDLLQRAKATRRSNGLSRVARVRNVRGVFRVPAAMRAKLKAAHVVLVDDVLTSGATAAACARVLRRAGAVRVDVLTYARVAHTDVSP